MDRLAAPYLEIGRAKRHSWRRLTADGRSYIREGADRLQVDVESFELTAAAVKKSVTDIPDDDGDHLPGPGRRGGHDAVTSLATMRSMCSRHSASGSSANSSSLPAGNCAALRPPTAANAPRTHAS